MDEITAVLISWKDAEETEAAVAALAAARRRIPTGGVKTSLIVVENGGDTLRRQNIFALWPSASLLVNDSNVGFGPAANQAADVAAGDVLLFLNPDTRAEEDVFSGIARAFESDAQVVAVAPRLDDFSGPAEKNRTGRLALPAHEDQFTFQLRRLPTLGGDVRELLLIDHLFPNSSSRRRRRYADSDRGTPFEVEQAAAAALAVRKRVFRRIGGFDERYVPAWFEDVDLCARLLREGKILYSPQARLRHRGGASARRLTYARFLPIYYRNALLYRREHYRRSSRGAYRPLLAAGMLLRLAALPFRRGMPRSREEAARAYLRVLALASGFSSSPIPRLPSSDRP